MSIRHTGHHQGFSFVVKTWPFQFLILLMISLWFMVPVSLTIAKSARTHGSELAIVFDGCSHTGTFMLIIVPWDLIHLQLTEKDVEKIQTETYTPNKKCFLIRYVRFWENYKIYFSNKMCVLKCSEQKWLHTLYCFRWLQSFRYFHEDNCTLRMDSSGILRKCCNKNSNRNIYT